MHELCGRPLKFGDVEQIKAIDKIKSEAALKAARKKKSPRSYKVNIEFTGSTIYTVFARDREEAKDLAVEQFTVDRSMVTVDFTDVLTSEENNA